MLTEHFQILEVIATVIRDLEQNFYRMPKKYQRVVSSVKTTGRSCCR